MGKKKVKGSHEDSTSKSNHTSRLISHSGISASSDFASRNRDTYLTFILNCRSDYLVAYPQKEQKTYKTKLSRMKLDFNM